MIEMMTENIWEDLCLEENLENVKLLARVPMNDKDKIDMEANHDNKFSHWVIALFINEDHNSLVAWGINEKGYSDTDMGHLCIEAFIEDEDLTARWFDWIRESKTGLRE